jgi:hypothetical protein
VVVLASRVDERPGLPVAFRSGRGRDGGDQQQRWNNGRDSKKTHRDAVIPLLIWTPADK